MEMGKYLKLLSLPNVCTHPKNCVNEFRNYNSWNFVSRNNQYFHRNGESKKSVVFLEAAIVNVCPINSETEYQKLTQVYEL